MLGFGSTVILSGQRLKLDQLGGPTDLAGAAGCNSAKEKERGQAFELSQQHLQNPVAIQLKEQPYCFFASPDLLPHPPMFSLGKYSTFQYFQGFFFFILPFKRKVISYLGVYCM